MAEQHITISLLRSRRIAGQPLGDA